MQRIYKHFETPEQAMVWASSRFVPNVSAIRSALQRSEDYKAEIPDWDLEVVFTLTDALTHLEQQGMKRLSATDILDAVKSWE